MRRLLSISFVLLGVVAGVLTTQTAQAAPKKAIPALNRKVLSYLVSHKGKKVGDGICHTLVDRALRAVGAQPPQANSVTWTYGRRLVRGDSIKPGDVILFKNAKYHGGWDFPYHVAFIGNIRGSKVSLVHQNVGGKRFVQVTPLDLREKQQGKVTYFRPIYNHSRATVSARLPASMLRNPTSGFGPEIDASIESKTAVRPQPGHGTALLWADRFVQFIRLED